jgi:hypothetical protein
LNVHVPPSGFPALVLNADFRPLSYYPLSLWSWQDAIKAVFLERVDIVAQYERKVHSPSFEIQLPSVVSLKSFVKPTTHPAFTRFNVFLRDRFAGPQHPDQLPAADHVEAGPEPGQGGQHGQVGVGLDGVQDPPAERLEGGRHPPVGGGHGVQVVDVGGRAGGRHHLVQGQPADAQAPVEVAEGVGRPGGA